MSIVCFLLSSKLRLLLMWGVQNMEMKKYGAQVRVISISFIPNQPLPAWFQKHQIIVQLLPIVLLVNNLLKFWEHGWNFMQTCKQTEFGNTTNFFSQGVMITQLGLFFKILSLASLEQSTNSLRMSQKMQILLQLIHSQLIVNEYKIICD